MPVSENLRRLIAAGITIGTVVGIGAVAETKADGGFIRDIWEGLKTPSPVISMCLGFAIWVIWREWQKDRKEHRDRTEVFTATLNRYARLLEKQLGSSRGANRRANRDA